MNILHRIIIAVLIIFYVALNNFYYQKVSISVWGDSYEYLTIASLPLASDDFWANTRPGVVPMLYKLAGADFVAITNFQLIFSMAAWLLLAFATAYVLKHAILKLVGFAAILLLSLCSNVFYWHKVVLTESLSNSWFVIVVAVWLLGLAYLRHPQNRTHAKQALWAVVILSSLLIWGFTRDSNAYHLLIAVGYIVGIAALYKAQIRGWGLFFVIICLGCLVIFGVANHSANVGTRWRGPLGNVMLMRILPEDGKRAFFIERGMPYDEAVRAYANDPQNVAIPPHYLSWLYVGRDLYPRYLLSDPISNMVAPLRDRGEILDESLLHYARIENLPLGQKILDRWLYHYRGFWWLFLLLIGIGLPVYLLWKRQLGLIELVPLFLLISLYPMMFLVWHGDSLEIGRHSVMVSIQARIGLWLLILLCIDRLVMLSRATFPLPLSMNSTGLVNRVARLGLLMIVLEVAFLFHPIQRHILLPIQTQLGLRENYLRFWGVSSVEFNLFQEGVESYLQDAKIVAISEDSDMMLIDADRWLFQDEHEIENVNVRRAVQQWAETGLPRYLWQLDVGYIYLETQWLDLADMYIQNAINNPAYYTLIETDHPSRRLYQVRQYGTQVDTVNLDHEHMRAYQAHLEQFSMVGPEDVIFNPASGLDWFRDLGEISNLINQVPMQESLRLKAILDFFVIFEMMRSEDELQLTDAQAAAITQWRATKDSLYLYEAGVTHLLFNDLWWSYLSEAEAKLFIDQNGYTLVTAWDNDIPGSYHLYKVNNIE